MNKYSKHSVAHSTFHITKFTKKSHLPNLIFIHGGPGLNNGAMEYLIEHHRLFKKLHCNIILYDQRGCGRSEHISGNVLHQDNVNDLQEVISHLNVKFKIHGLIGHSYGAKLLFDYYKQFHSDLPGVFISTASSIMIPRANNLMLDLSYLKKIDEDHYNVILKELTDISAKTIWNLSEKLAPIFQQNKERPFYYWANMDFFHLYQDVQTKIMLPINKHVFNSVRKDLYLKESNFSVNINELNVPKLWINGLHDYISNGHEAMAQTNPLITTFFQSSHYPHLEENDYFSEILNQFMANQGHY